MEAGFSLILFGPPAVIARTPNDAAYTAYLRGRQLVDTNGSDAQWRMAVAAFDTAITADPGFAAAYAGRARARTMLIDFAIRSNETSMKSLADSAVAARRAIALNPDLPDAQATLGWTLALVNLDYAAAAAPFDRAMTTAAAAPTFSSFMAILPVTPAISAKARRH